MVLDNFLNAQKKCNIAKRTSDLSSAMEDDRSKKKRKIKRQIKTCSISESGKF